ncbi:GNAT family N-acetyltransferase [Rhizorhabdus dicambivorans]|uniref:N-acetyltransferase n=1 Tax=Rhizorhabdus dicambivorans TaxID=1850238 RepID=A0A2A4FLL1_9SPHN|nr:N-acetyltransferase [Rhizorhabdus dicambivorans]ATE66483.1 N-acetyltransferase [Rhizorhabdus dicambivorans]PCE39635.1 N-acetyltransferase [Rhizorhabdus dicambivorans]
MIIRPETPLDHPAIARLTEVAFRGIEHSSQTEAAIVDALRDAGALTLSLVAETDQGIVGHAAFSPVRIDGAEGGWFGLGPVSVLPGCQRGGIGSALIGRGLDRLRQRGAGGCVVLGDPAYYRRFGFSSRHALRYGDVPPDYFQSLMLAGTPAAGEVSYHEGFEATASGR